MDDPLFDPGTLSGFPTPAQRLLARALPAGVPLRRTIVLRMHGRIRLKRWWLPFTAEQVLEAGTAFAWRPVVGGRLLRFTGANELGPEGARTAFRFHGRVPVVDATGPDVDRSAPGRLAAETVVWLPQALTPQAGVVWVPIGEETGSVTIGTPAGHIAAEVDVDMEGRVTGVALERWGDPEGSGNYAAHRFGGRMDAEFITDAGVRIAGAGSVGGGWGMADWPAGDFFRFEIDRAGPIR